MDDAIHIVYAGGTFACHGKPLSVLDKDVFLPRLAQQIGKTRPVVFLDNPTVKDSSAFTPRDFVDFYRLIKDAHAKGARRFLFITGSDTLSFLAAFLAIGLQSLPVCVTLVASMLPLFDPDRLPLEVLKDSDAWPNLQNALAFLDNRKNGVFVGCSGQILRGDSVQKIHTSCANAFVGQSATDDTPARWYPRLRLPDTPRFLPIYTYHCVPNDAASLSDYLLYLSTKPPSAALLLGFGAGNLPYSDAIADALNALNKAGFLLIVASSSPLGAVSDAYAAGSWLYKNGVLSGGSTPFPALYALALWLCLSATPDSRRSQWLDFIQKNSSL